VAVTVICFVLLTLLVFNPIEGIHDEYYLGAHRGDSILYIENTIPAFESALANDSYFFIELDVQYTKDKIPVVYHDATLLRMEKKFYRIRDITYERLLEESSYHIPTYDEVMSLLGGKKPLNIEIKSQGRYWEDVQLVEHVISDIEARNITNTTLISSISAELITYVNDKYNNRSHYYNYADYWITQKRAIDTGLIFYADENTFLYRIPVISFLTRQAQGLLLYFRTPTQSEFYLTGANYLMLHGSNSRHYETLKRYLPYHVKIVIWTLDDRMYLIIPKEEFWKEMVLRRGYSVEKSIPWWEDYVLNND